MELRNLPPYIHTSEEGVFLRRVYKNTNNYIKLK